MTGPGQDTAGERARYLVGVVKRPPDQRPVFRAVVPDAAALAARGWLDALGAEDDESAVAVGEPAVFSVELTPGEVAAFAQDPDVRWLELEPAHLQPVPPAPAVPLLDWAEAGIDAQELPG